MLYHQLASSFDDLAPVTTLIEKLKNPHHRHDAVMNEKYLYQLFNNIRSATAKHIPLFAGQGDCYANYLLIEANSLLIYVLEVIKDLNKQIYLNNSEICLVTNFNMLASLLRALVTYFEELQCTRR
jgi:hypothetical protein